jgi:hypothetical protein
MEGNLVYLKSIDLINTIQNGLTETSGIMLDHVSRCRGPAKLTHKAKHYSIYSFQFLIDPSDWIALGGDIVLYTNTSIFICQYLGLNSGL